MKFWKRWIADYRGKTQGCSLAEVGAYDRLLDEYYTHERPLPADKVALYRICGAMDNAERTAVDRTVANFFNVGDDGMLHNTRADSYLADEMEFIQDQRDRGRRGGLRAAQRRNADEEAGQSITRANGHKFELDALPEEWRIFCFGERPDLDSAAIFEKFKDHWRANANQRTAKKSDWLAAWRNWVRKEPRDRNAAPDYSKVMNKFAD